MGSSKIVATTKLHGQFVYNALATLEEKGLVKHSVVNGRKKFQANTPERLSQLIDEKENHCRENKGYARGIRSQGNRTRI